jgi:zinc protease
MASLFGDWKAKEPFVRVPRAAVPLTARDETIDTPDKEMAIVLRGTTFAMRDDDPRYPAVRFANFILGASPKSLLLTALRHEGGLSYGARSVFSADDRDRYARLLGYAICAPQNARKAQAAMHAELQRWLAGELTDEEIAEIGRGYREDFQTRLGNDAFVAAQLVEDLQIDRPFTFHQEVVEAGAQLDGDELRRTLREVFDDAVFVDFVGGDVAKFADDAAAGDGG